jgi:hypothetical protein
VRPGCWPGRAGAAGGDRVTIDWGWLAATYAGWRIAGLQASGTRDRQELVLTLERQVGAPTSKPGIDLLEAAQGVGQVHDVEALRLDGWDDGGER